MDAMESNYYVWITMKSWNNISDRWEAVIQMCSITKVLLDISQNSREDTCTRVYLRPATFLKKRLWHICLPVNFVKFLRTPFYRRTPVVASYRNICTKNKEPAPLKWRNRNYREVDFLSLEKELNSEILTLLGKEWMIFS